MADKKKQIKREEVVDKKKALEDVLARIEKDFGKGAIMLLGENTKMNVETISTGSVGLDKAIGVGGLPKGRIIEIYGPESSGKTTVALHCVAEAQKIGGSAAFIDAEHALDPVYAKNIGVDIDNLYISQPDNGEQALEITDTMVRSGAVDVIVVDSVAALTPQAEIEGDMGDSHMGLQARLMSQALRKLTAIIGKSKTLLIFINQIRMKIGVMFGNPETTTGGNALKFYSSLRLEVRRIESIDAKGEEDVVGNRVRVKVVKNKVAPPFRKVELDIMFGKGVSAYASLLDSAVRHGFIDKKGAWYTTEDEKVGQGRENAIAFLEQNKDFAADIEKKIREKLFPGQVLPKKDAANAKAAVRAPNAGVNASAAGSASAGANGAANAPSSASAAAQSASAGSSSAPNASASAAASSANAAAANPGADLF